MRALVAAFTAGVVFAIGLSVAGMTLPSKVIGFLDVTGNWDPSLGFVMGGAVGVYAVAARLILRRPAPILEPRFELPTRKDIDARLLVGAAIFGVGWGLSGYCPGPAVVGLAKGALPTAIFVGAMLLGMLLHAGWTKTRPPEPEG